ncbi:porin family protein [Massilia solisilvae]|uniref:Porin family protein n=1 Tax=Massilia solisilvae TaxID=1811225 RepID=A0ABT2BPR3_9BURK|nr:porin family protein [Massilia solisilvae]MCS0610509.1 porin family protein [Massilia solisilvae]
MIKQFIAATMLAGLGLSAASYAAEPVTNPFYAGVEAGVTKNDDYSNTRSSYGAYLGYNVNQNFAVEAGARRLSSYDDPWRSLRSDQYSLSVIGSLPVNEKLSVFGRVGASHIVNKVSFKAVGQPGVPDFQLRDEDTHLLLGVGASYKLTEKVSARLELQRPQSGVKNLSAGVHYAF